MADAKFHFEERIPARIAANPDGAKGIGAVFLFKITGDGGGVWTLNLKDNPGVTAGDSGCADCTLEMTGESWEQIMKSPGSSLQLFFLGKLKISGNILLATKLQQII